MIWLHVAPRILIAFGSILAILALASLIVLALKTLKPGCDFTELSARVKSWWVMFAIFAVAIAVGRIVSIVFFAFLSFLALKEYLSLIPTRRADRRVLFWVYLTIPIQYFWVADNWYGMFLIFIPVYAFLLVPLRMVTIGNTTHFLRAAGTIQWGMMLMVFCLSHLAFLLVLPPIAGFATGGVGLVLYLVFLTQFNDVAQYTWGKLFGRHKIVPTVSPKKTAEGLIGGVATTTLLGWLLAPWLTPLTHYQGLFAGLLIGMAGFAGDVTISALKRDLGVKDSGQLIPGHGGILDRIDSLIYAAPLFFHYVYYLHY